MLQKRLDYGFQLPFVPRAPRSARSRGPVQQKAVENQLCAFDLLATVAGKLLEGDSSHNTPTEELQQGNVPLSDVIMEDQNNSHTLFGPEQGHNGKEISKPMNNTSLSLSSMVTSSHCLETNEIPDNLDMNNDKNGYDMYSSNSRGNNVNLVNRDNDDDDENSSECIQPSTIKATRLPARVNNRRFQKLLASKYWRIASKVKDGDLSQTELRCIYRRRRTGCKQQRSRRIYPFKKRKFYRYTSLSNSNRDTGSTFSTVKHGVNGSSSCVAGKGLGFGSRESHVKLRIKSFRVPELFIEIPETATIGSLKRTVMDAVTSLLGGGLRVGVLLKGKKVRDDKKTLAQSGICCQDEKVESLGFTLEPNFEPNLVRDSTPTCSEDDLLALCTDAPQPISRCPTIGVNLHGSLPDDHMMSNVGNLVESDHDSAPSPTEFTLEKVGVDYRALVALPEGTPQALSVVPTLHKSKRSDVAQRRIRRPFSVSEVEALVQAVEKLGTGRWRDVKLRAFENVKHRTYVDLKDKWKTLVHTARISPQQRRGEPVPQELLDRVLSAHSYWSQHQAKQQLVPSDPCLL